MKGIEMIVVVVILGILTAIFIPACESCRNQTEEQQEIEKF